MKKLHRDRIRVMAAEGVDFERMEYRGKHTAYVCAEGTIFAASTPSDNRDFRHFRSDVRRLARGG